MADDSGLVRGLLLILGNEVQSSGESDLIDILIDLLGCHTDSVILEYDSLCIVIVDNVDLVVFAVGNICLAEFNQSFKLSHCISAVGHQLSYEYVLIRIKPLSYYGKYILRSN